MTDTIEVLPATAPVGAEVLGLDVSVDLSADQVADLRQALLDHCVLVFRDQHITDEDQVRFTRYFGTPVEHVRQQRERRVKEVFIISNVKQNGEPIGALGSERIDFHADLSYLHEPGTISLLLAVEIPAVGGQTQWCDCRAAYDALPQERQDHLRTLRAVHRHYVEEQNPPEPAIHPVVCTHPETGVLSLYVNPHLTSHIEGVARDEGDALLRELYDHMDQPQFIYTHEWRLGDLIMWDNRPTMHRRLAFPDEQRRIMNRTQVFGEGILA
ncbi:MAG: TauD/TfdA family dioxygenase [Candidatus Latescibacteria bacterium]|nr:TauD/TfdA family dioxygenase [Candidatus Latescibacterota bacterium]MDP7449655.1 TauD/TfdA family dioxygenase [Candidatus Latescibacterota bacterium]HJP30111.1 TauD/TfdA family dioxygenase [Candidatus Latescibacterota bacterium]